MNPSTSLNTRRILLGITGGIAAYKSAELTRLLQRAGAEVRVVMTSAATEFITPLTLQALSGNRVHTELLDAEADRKSTRLNSSHVKISYAVFCLKKKKANSTVS